VAADDLVRCVLQVPSVEFRSDLPRFALAHASGHSRREVCRRDERLR
jgi:hypothetical protein